MRARSCPRAINSVMWRIALFYVGSVVLLVLLMPWTAYKAGVSPFVTFFGALGVPGIGTVMNIVVLTAALSSLNSGLYSTGRVLRSLAMGGSAPPFVSRMNAQKVPYGGILVTLVVYLFGVVLNYLRAEPGVRDRAQHRLARHRQHLGLHRDLPDEAAPGAGPRRDRAGRASACRFAPFTSWLTLAFLLGVLVLMAFDYPDGTYTIAAIPVVVILLGIGWRVLKGTSPFAPTAPSYVLTHQVELDESAP